MKKRIVSVVLAMTMIFSLAACGANTKKEEQKPAATKEEQKEEKKVNGGSLVMAVPGDMTTLNPAFDSGDEGKIMLEPVYDPLYVVNKDGVRYYLAESREVTDDGKTITVKLREGLKWHDGQPITADDLVWNIEFRKNPENSSTKYALVKGNPVTAEKIDDLTVKVTLPDISAAYDHLLGTIIMIPKHIYENEANIKESELNTTQSVGSGPYKMVEWNKGESFVLERNDDYYKDVNLDSVVFKIIPVESAQEVAFENGEINVMRVSNAEMYEKYAADDRYQMISMREGRVNYMQYNKNSELTKDIRVREAIAKALNVQEIVDAAYGSDKLAVPAKNVFTEENFYYADTPGYEQDVEEAKKLVSEVGLEGKTLRLIYNSSRPNMEDCALMIQSQLKEVGVNVEITGYETQGFFEKFLRTDLGDWELGLNGYATNTDNERCKNMWSGEGTMARNVVATDEITQLWKDGDGTIVPEKRAEIYKELEQKIKDEYVVVPLSDTNYVMVADKNLRGLDAINMVPVFEDYTEIYMVE